MRRVNSWRWNAPSSFARTHGRDARRRGPVMTPSSSATAAWATAISGRSGGKNRVDQPRSTSILRRRRRRPQELRSRAHGALRQLRHTRRLGSATADQQQVAGAVALREPSREERPDPDGATGDGKMTPSSKDDPPEVGAGPRRGKRLNSGDQDGAVPERKLRLRPRRARPRAGRSESSPPSASRRAKRPGCSEWRCDKPGNRCRGQLRVLAVSGRQRLRVVTTRRRPPADRPRARP